MQVAVLAPGLVELVRPLHCGGNGVVLVVKVLNVHQGHYCCGFVVLHAQVVGAD